MAIMRPITWRTRRLTTIGVGVLILYFCLRLKRQTVTTSAVFSDTQPVDVWEFMADFSNMKLLNPTIKNFNILSEEGNLKHWKYTVEYTEDLSHWPYWENIGLGQFAIRPDGTDYVIESTHTTCFLMGIYCVKSRGEFRFSPVTSHSGTRCTEHVTFECPTILTSFCRREAEFQRQEIMNNLRLQFNAD